MDMMITQYWNASNYRARMTEVFISLCISIKECFNRNDDIKELVVEKLREHRGVESLQKIKDSDYRAWKHLKQLTDDILVECVSTQIVE